MGASQPVGLVCVLFRPAEGAGDQHDASRSQGSITLKENKVCTSFGLQTGLMKDTLRSAGTSARRWSRH